MNIVKRQDDQEVQHVGSHHLCRDICGRWQMVRHVCERRPDGHEHSMHTLGSGIGIDAVPEESDDHPNDHYDEREEESERRPALDGVRDIVSGTNHTIGRDQQGDAKVA